MKKTKKLVWTALFATLTFVATYAIRVPVPATQGYVHPGDALVILSGIFLGPWFGAAAAGLGSAMSDLLGGYAYYAPITLLIKALVAFTGGYVFTFIRRHKFPLPAGIAAAGICDIVFVVGGYFIAERFMYGLPAALLSAPMNLVQAAFGLVVSVLLFPSLAAIPDFRRSIHLPVTPQKP
ncbi:MAG: ECF transporter S component [Lachnospiraceae bacterium]